ncbi:MAG: hypothetical protein M3364_02630 [Actinomycetota bacterium]|nr:hypothetical protein [Actinomycetota bacterium]
MLATIATLYGIAAAAAVLLQARQMLERRRSCEVSAGLFAIYAGGYGVWLAYGIGTSSVPLILVNAFGVITASITVGIALSLRGALRRPSSWASCPVPTPA